MESAFHKYQYCTIFGCTLQSLYNFEFMSYAVVVIMQCAHLHMQLEASTNNNEKRLLFNENSKKSHLFHVRNDFFLFSVFTIQNCHFTKIVFKIFFPLIQLCGILSFYLSHLNSIELKLLNTLAKELNRSGTI